MTKAEQKAFEPINGEAIAVREAPPTPMSILEIAVKSGMPMSVETMTQLFALHREVKAEEARNAFNEAFAAAKAEFPKIEKTKVVDFTSRSGIRVYYKYAPLDKITEAVNPVLAKHGLSYNWKQERGAVAGNIQVTCVLKHVRGHFDTNTLEGPPDDSGAKDALKAIKSSTSYLRRGTLEGVLGIATADEDSEGLSNADALDFLALIKESETLDDLKKHYRDACADALSKRLPKVCDLYMAAREKREKELAA